MSIGTKIQAGIFMLAILMSSHTFIFSADYTQHEDFGRKNPGDVVSFTVTPPGKVLTGSVKNAGGFVWTGGPASFTGTIPEDFAGAHKGIFKGTYEPKGVGPGKPRTYTWRATTEASVINVKIKDGENHKEDPATAIPVGGSATFYAEVSPQGTAGTFQWTKVSENITLTNETTQTVTVTALQNVSASETISVTFTPTGETALAPVSHSFAIIEVASVTARDGDDEKTTKSTDEVAAVLLVPYTVDEKGNSTTTITISAESTLEDDGKSVWPEGKPVWSLTKPDDAAELPDKAKDEPEKPFDYTATKTGTYTFTAECGNEVPISVVVFQVEIKAEDGESEPPDAICVGKTTKFKAKVPDGVTGDFNWLITKYKKFAETVEGTETQQTVSVEGKEKSVHLDEAVKVIMELWFKLSGATEFVKVDEHEFYVVELGISGRDHVVLYNEKVKDHYKPLTLEATAEPGNLGEFVWTHNYLGDGEIGYDNEMAKTEHTDKESTSSLEITGYGKSSKKDDVEMVVSYPGANGCQVSHKFTVQKPDHEDYEWDNDAELTKFRVTRYATHTVYGHLDNMPLVDCWATEQLEQLEGDPYNMGEGKKFTDEEGHFPDKCWGPSGGMAKWRQKIYAGGYHIGTYIVTFTGSDITKKKVEEELEK